MWVCGWCVCHAAHSFGSCHGWGGSQPPHRPSPHRPIAGVAALATIPTPPHHLRSQRRGGPPPFGRSASSVSGCALRSRHTMRRQLGQRATVRTSSACGLRCATNSCSGRGTTNRSRQSDASNRKSILNSCHARSPVSSSTTGILVARMFATSLPDLGPGACHGFRHGDLQGPSCRLSQLVNIEARTAPTAPTARTAMLRSQKWLQQDQGFAATTSLFWVLVGSFGVIY